MLSNFLRYADNLSLAYLVRFNPDMWFIVDHLWKGVTDGDLPRILGGDHPRVRADGRHVKSQGSD